ncbi:MAG: GNAT family N-acetyltransferase [Candidatus Competibacterales bacterium]
MALETEGLALDCERVQAGVAGLMARPALGFYLVAEVEAAPGLELAGALMVTFEWSDWRNGVIWWIQSVYVRPPRRRQGLYRHLYREVESRARAAGDVRALRLYVADDNAKAQTTYQALGMADAGYRVFEAPLGG